MANQETRKALAPEGYSGVGREGSPCHWPDRLVQTTQALCTEYGGWAWGEEHTQFEKGANVTFDSTPR